MSGRTRIVLLPGMDGTGELLQEFVNSLPPSFDAVIVRYPTQQVLSYKMLDHLVHAACATPQPLVLVAESFSTPLALKFAAKNPPNLRAVVLCAGFATAPVKGLSRWLLRALAPAVFHLPLPTFAAKRLLVGKNAPQSLVDSVRATISSVKPAVLAARLRAMLACDVREAASRIRVPMLYIRPTADRLVDVTAMKELQQVNPGMAVIEIEGPHFILQGEPRRAAEVLFDPRSQQS